MNKKEYKIGEIFESEYGQLICKEAEGQYNTSCNGCILFDLGNRGCAREVFGICVSHKRSDHTSVIFAKVETEEV